jgi:hypothetical protein
MSAHQNREWTALRDAKMLGWMAGNQEAVDAVNTICSICDVWDDLIDADKPVAPADINAAFTRALIGLQLNGFYKRHEASFFGLLVTGVNAWLDANELQKSPSEKWRMLAFYIRTFGFEITNLAAFLSGGWDHLRRVSVDMRMFFENETYSEWEHRIGASDGLER